MNGVLSNLIMKQKRTDKYKIQNAYAVLLWTVRHLVHTARVCVCVRDISVGLGHQGIPVITHQF